MTVISQVKRYTYNWSRPEMCNNFSQSEDDQIFDQYHTFFKRLNEGSWKGEAQTLACLSKIMSGVDKHVYHVVKGLVQSGKSQLIIYYCAWMAHAFDMNVVVMLRNQTADIKSLVEKFRRFKNEKGIREIEVIQFAKYLNAMDIQDVVDKFTESKKVFIILGNSDQLEKLNQVMESSQGVQLNPFAMCIDELDLNEKEESTRFGQEFERLKSSGLISHIMGVTGTSLPVLFKRIDQLTSDQVVSLEAPLNYKGIHNITFTEIDIKDEKIVQKIMLQMLKTKYAFYDKEGERHPSVLLVKDERIKSNQIEMMETLLQNEKIKKKWAVIVYNGDGIFVQLPCGKTIQKCSTINECLQTVKTKFGNSIEYIAIISGDLANRGLSFVSEDYSWHLTHMILCAKDKSSGSNLMQYARLCGCYNDDIPLEMFTSVEIQKELFAYDNLQERCVERCEDPLMDEVQLKEALGKMKLEPDCVVRRPIDSKLKVKYTNVSNWDKIMCGGKLPTDNLEEAIELVKKEYGETPRILVREEKLHVQFTIENCQKVKTELKKEITKGVRIISQTKSSLHKNPKFVTSDRQDYKVMIGEKAGMICLYHKMQKWETLDYNALYIFEAPQGIFVARNTDKDDLENLFVKYSLQFI